jgi:hypothetical protein
MNAKSELRKYSDNITKDNATGVPNKKIQSDGFISRIRRVGRIIRAGTDLALATASDYAIAEGEEKLKEFCEKSRKDLVVSASLNGVMLLFAVLSVIFLQRRNGIGILAAALVNYVILGRALFNAARFLRTILIPYRRLIAFTLPVFFNGLAVLKSLKLAIQVSIVAVFDYFYKDKVPPTLKIAHEISSAFGLIKNREEIKNKAADDFYPLVCRFFRVVLLYNVLLFTVCYGAVVFIVKRFMFNAMLGMGFLDLFIYPFAFFLQIGSSQ